ncbi:MAG: prephenate dehydratase [Planctomycetes bacterium]|nr:prephenate dehydratase [Planctomycetota bacterium]
MGKERSGKKPAKPAPSRANGAALRAQLERLDRDLVKLINDRARIALQMDQLRGVADGEVEPVRWDDEVIARAIANSKGPLPPESVRATLREVISGCRMLEKRLRVAYLGPAYSYTHLAAMQRFGQSAELVPVGSISAVFEELNRAHADYGVVPIENSTDGRVADTLDMFTRIPVRICGEVQLRIHHHLLGKCPRSEVKEVYSRPQALSQCRNWLAKHLPAARTIEMTSTSAAAQLAQEKQGAAAIASIQAGIHYGLNVLAENIEDNPANLTRFAVLGEQSAARTGKDKSAVMFEIEHRSGALADALNIFKRNRLNLTWIESFPISRPQGGYLFFVELDGHESDAKVRKATEALGRRALRLEVLGSYPKAEPAE